MVSITRCGTCVPAGPSRKIGSRPLRRRCSAGNCWRSTAKSSMMEPVGARFPITYECPIDKDRQGWHSDWLNVYVGSPPVQPLIPATVIGSWSFPGWYAKFCQDVVEHPE